MVTLEPPSNDTTMPPTIAAIIPDMGGASLARAKPRPKGSAMRETTNPEKIFLGKVFTKFWVWLVFGDKSVSYD